MVINLQTRSRRERGALMTELFVAMSLLAIAVLPVGYSVVREQTLARSYYERAVAMEIVDGEMERLASGAWRSFSPGEHDYAVHANAAANLPEGKFRLTLGDRKVRLEWIPAKKHHGGPVMREVMVK